MTDDGGLLATVLNRLFGKYAELQASDSGSAIRLRRPWAGLWARAARHEQARAQLLRVVIEAFELVLEWDPGERAPFVSGEVVASGPGRWRLARDVEPVRLLEWLAPGGWVLVAEAPAVVRIEADWDGEEWRLTMGTEDGARVAEGLRAVA